jgi:hypothetical protein
LSVSESASKKAGMKGLRFGGIAFALSVFAAFQFVAAGDVSPLWISPLPVGVLIVLTLVFGINPPPTMLHMIVYLILMARWALTGVISHWIVSAIAPAQHYSMLGVAALIAMVFFSLVSLTFIAERNRQWRIEAGGSSGRPTV